MPVEVSDQIRQRLVFFGQPYFGAGWGLYDAVQGKRNIRFHQEQNRGDALKENS